MLKLYHVLLLFTIVGEFLLPFVLKHFYPGYDSLKQVMSVLGSGKSPVRAVYNAWLVWLGCFLGLTAALYGRELWGISRPLAVLETLSIGCFALGAGVLAGLFSVGESKRDAGLPAKIHGAGAAAGFTALLFFPLLEGVRAIKLAEPAAGVWNFAAFLLAAASFTLFVMGDKERFQNTPVAWEGLWERAALLFMYFPFLFRSIRAVWPL